MDVNSRSSESRGRKSRSRRDTSDTSSTCRTLELAELEFRLFVETGDACLNWLESINQN
jgi:hypothetical protein